MIQALQQLDQEGHPLKIGLFLDTTILNDEDLTTDRGKQILYASIRDYYSKIPPRLWAAIGGQPVIWLYDAQRVGAFDQSTFDYVYDQFAQDFGGLRPYIVREDQWYTERAPTNRVIQTEGMYGWGAAVFGYNPDPRYTVCRSRARASTTRSSVTDPTASIRSPGRRVFQRRPGASAGVRPSHPGDRDMERVGRRLRDSRDARIWSTVHRHPAQLRGPAQRPRVATCDEFVAGRLQE